MEKMFIYYSCVDEKETEVTSIRMYGLGPDNQNICIRINNFTPYVYIELPTDIVWSEAKAQLISRKIDQIMGNAKPLKKFLIYRYKLYGAYLDENGDRKKFPYLYCSFSSKNDINHLCARLRKDIGTIVGIGSHIKLKVHEQDASPILQLTCARNINTVGWISFKGKEVPTDERVTICDEEYYVKWKEIVKYETDTIGNPLVMGFDIEVNSSNPSAMPNADKVGDKIFQISCVFTRTTEDSHEPYLLTLGETEEELLGEGTRLLQFKTEADLLIGFTKLVRKKKPNVIMGYNILGFDIPYMIKRQEKQGCGREFTTMGFNAFSPAIQRKIKWSSSAYGSQEFEYLDAEGIIFVDLLPLVQRDYKLDNYKLKTVSEHFLKDDTKADLSVSGIFKCYRIGTKKELDGTYSKKARKAIALCGKYCVQDSLLVVKLMKKMQTWVGLCEMAKTVNTSIFCLYTQGQQIKVFSQVYKYATDNNIVVEKDGYQTKDDERYVGAHVFPPVPGIYDAVVPFDFCLSGDTLVTLSNGLSKRLDSLVDDEEVIAYKVGMGFATYSMIHGLQRKGIRQTVKVIFEDESSIVSTPDHKFMLENTDWCEAKDLSGKFVKTGVDYVEGKKKVIDVRPNGLQEVFDIEVKDVHNFLANGVVVHNCSLYPTTIIAYNIDYSTLVTDDAYPDSKCHVMKWEDHLGCEHDPKVIRRLELSKIIEGEKEEIKKLRTQRDLKSNKLRKQSIVNEINERTEKLKPFIEERSALVKTITKNVMCASRNYRFVKEPKGVLPTILQNLLDARKNTRNQIKTYSKTMTEENKNEINMLISVLDKRQLAYKISANSMYGAMGVKKGYLPFMPGAMCTTYKGRCNIEIVAKTIPEKYGGQLVYGDTDSNYIHFPHLKTSQESWDFAELVATEVSELFPKPIKLEFEAVIYWRFFILTKKRYMYKSCLRDGVVGEKIGKKGVLLARRDSSVFVRTLYEDIIKMIFNKESKNDILYYVVEEVNKLCSNSLDYKKFVITKSVGNTDNLQPTMVKNEKGVAVMMMGDYKVPQLPDDPKEKAEQLEKKNATTELEYYEKCLPAQVQLALKMRRRGHPVQSGTRLEYIITDIENHVEKQYEKIEDYDYFKKFSEVLTVDFFYYLKVAINSVDEVLNIAFGTEMDFVKQQYVYRYKVRRKVLNDIKSLNRPKIQFME
jgi:DNA polymerase elongation subunit (family B)